MELPTLRLEKDRRCLIVEKKPIQDTGVFKNNTFITDDSNEAMEISSLKAVLNFLNRKGQICAVCAGYVYDYLTLDVSEPLQEDLVYSYDGFVWTASELFNFEKHHLAFTEEFKEYFENQKSKQMGCDRVE